MAHQFIFTMKDLRKIVPPKREILKGIWLSFYPGAKIGVLGPNGAGKSTLLKIMAGVDEDFLGEAKPADRVRTGYLPQEPHLDPSKDVRGNVEDGVAEVRGLLTRFDEINVRLGEPMDPPEMEKVLEEQARVQDAIEAANGWDLDRTVEIAMDALRCPAGDADVATLSGGEVTRVAITHDRYFLDHVAGWILELDRGAGIPWEGNYSSWLDQKKQRLAQEEKQESARQRTLERELEWVRMSPRARQAKSKARLQAYETLLADGGKERDGAAEIIIPAGPRLGDVVVEAQHLFKGYGDRLLIEDLAFSLPRGGIVGVIGANGAGKTTLFRMITGQEKPDKGELRVGESVRLAYVDQSRDALDATKNVWEEISGGAEQLMLGGRPRASRSYVVSFNFKGADQQKRVGDLSGGERNRVHMAKLLQAGANLLLLDEPTNDLDVDTLRALEDALLAFAGCAVVISHDRWFLDRVATHMLAFEGDSKVVWFEGNYEDYEADRRKRLGAAAETPHRIRYKPLTRG